MFWSKESFQLRLGLVVVGLFIASAVTSCQELRYAAFGKSAVATIEGAKPIMVAGRRSLYEEPHEQMLTYSFADTDGTKRTEKDSVSLTFLPTLRDEAGRDAIAIQFIPGSPEASRIPSSGRWFLIGLFIAACAALTFVTVRFWRNYQAFERRKARSSQY